jgi:hypothetical protein
MVFDYFWNREKRAIPDEKYSSIKGNVLAACGVYLSNKGVPGSGGHLKRALALLLLFVTPLVAQQQPSTTKNPLDQLRDQAKEVFERAGMPLSSEQEKAVAVLIEERRQASEDLFNQLMDYRGGPVKGDQHDRAVAGIKLMIDEFRKGFRACLTREQYATWETYESGEGAQALDQLIHTLTGGETAKQETQFIRITNNAFTAEHGWYNGQSTSSESVQRGGVGAYHGEAQIRFKNAALNARNPFADNKPPYKERQLDFNFSGPVVSKQADNERRTESEREPERGYRSCHHAGWAFRYGSRESVPGSVCRCRWNASTVLKIILCCSDSATESIAAAIRVSADIRCPIAHRTGTNTMWTYGERWSPCSQQDALRDNFEAGETQRKQPL